MRSPLAPDRLWGLGLDKYNVMKVEMETNKRININFVKNIATDLEFDNPDDSTFIPTRNETTLNLVLNDKDGAKSVIAKRVANYSDYEFDKGIEDSFLNKIYIPEDELVEKDENYWLENRTEKLHQEPALKFHKSRMSRTFFRSSLTICSASFIRWNS